MDSDVQERKVFPSFLTSWLDGEKATLVQVQSFISLVCLELCKGNTTADKRAGSHFCSSRMVIPFAREEASSQNKRNKKLF